MNPGARCRADRPCPGGSESRNRLSESDARPVLFFCVPCGPPRQSKECSHEPAIRAPTCRFDGSGGSTAVRGAAAGGTDGGPSNWRARGQSARDAATTGRGSRREFDGEVQTPGTELAGLPDHAIARGGGNRALPNGTVPLCRLLPRGKTSTKGTSADGPKMAREYPHRRPRRDRKSV